MSGHVKLCVCVHVHVHILYVCAPWHSLCQASAEECV